MQELRPLAPVGDDRRFDPWSAAVPASLPKDAPPPARRRTGLARVLGPIGGGLALVGSKLQLLAVLFKFKLLGVVLTMLVSVGAYSLFWGWRFAAIFVALLLVHELGHVIQARREGLPASAPLFIPFVGALIGLKRLPDNAYAEAKLGLAGPVLGSLGALGVYTLGAATGSHLLIAAAYLGFFLNLFNLLPVVPLDGGRAMAALHPALWAVGAVGAVALAVALRSPFLIVFLLFFGREGWRRWQLRRRGGLEQQRYYEVLPRQRLAIAATYVALIALLLVGLDVAHVANPG
jgi:Zn-dependent protease